MINYSSRFWMNFAIAAVGLVAFALVPSFFNRGIVFLAGLTAINIVFALSWNLLFKGAGLLSFGHAMFMGAGTYTVAILTIHYPEVPFLLRLLAGAGMGGLLALVFGVVALRRSSGTYFAILTLAFSELVHLFITKTNFLGRNDGLVGVTRPQIDLGFVTLDLASGDNYYYFIIVAMGIAAFALWCLSNSPIGRLLQAVRQDPMRIAFLGVDVQSWQLIVFVISGLFASFAGAVLVSWSQIASPEIAHWSVSTMPMLYSLLGGAGSFWGPAVGAILFGAIEYGTRTMQGISDIVTGGFLLIVVLAIPGGILGIGKVVSAALRGRSARAPAAAGTTKA